MSRITAAGKISEFFSEKAIYDLQNGYACHKESHFVNTIQGRLYVGPGRRNMTTEYEVIKYAVYNSLGVGKKNAKTRKELCSCVKCSDRVLRKAIEDLRRDRILHTYIRQRRKECHRVLDFQAEEKDPCDKKIVERCSAVCFWRLSGRWANGII